MLERHRHAVIAVVVVAAVAVGSWLAVGQRPPEPTDPLGYVPADAVAVAYVRPGALEASAVGRALLPDGEAVARMERVCGFDPTRGLEELIAFVGEEDAERLGHLGLVARGELDRERLPRCLERLVQAEGGSTRLTDLGGVPAIASAGGGSQAVFLGDRAVAVGAAASVRGAVRTVRGEAPNATTNPTLQELWTKVGRDRDLAVLADLPERWRRAATALARRRLGVALEGLESIGVGADLAKGLQLGAVLRLGAPEHAQAAGEQIRARLEALRRKPVVAFSVLGKVLRRVSAASQGPELVVTLELDEDEVAEVRKLLGDLRGARRDASPPTPDRAAPAPDAVLRRGEPPAERDTEDAPSAGEPAR
ncbi:MAG: hypothetical protein ACODAU_03015 [Myxococcota bacterium]